MHSRVHAVGLDINYKALHVLSSGMLLGTGNIQGTFESTLASPLAGQGAGSGGNVGRHFGHYRLDRSN